MKKFSLFLIVVLFGFTGLTSCLKGGENTSTRAFVGVLDFGKNFTTPVLKTLYGDFYSSELNSLMSSGKLTKGDCCYFEITYNLDLPENSVAMVELNGYYTGTILTMAKADRFDASSYLRDTSEVLQDEIAVSQIISESNDPFGYVENYLYVTHIVSHEDDATLSWDMSYDGGNIVTEENGKRNYNLFVRATKTGGDDTKTKSNQYHFNAYNNTKYFLENAARMEKELLGSSYAASSSTFTVKFNYVSGITDDQITWNSKAMAFYIAMFIPDSY
jgi:hypothetical protein